MIANSPSDSTFLSSGGALVCLTFNTEVHDVVSANGAVIDNNVPSPESDGVPL